MPLTTEEAAELARLMRQRARVPINTEPLEVHLARIRQRLVDAFGADLDLAEPDSDLPPDSPNAAAGLHLPQWKPSIWQAFRLSGTAALWGGPSGRERWAWGTRSTGAAVFRCCTPKCRYTLSRTSGVIAPRASAALISAVM